MTAKHHSTPGLAIPDSDDVVSRQAGIPISRRAVLRSGLSGAAGLLLAGKMSRPTLAAEPRAKAKAVIQIWMWGGPSQLDTFDPKPEAGDDFCGPLNRPIRTNVNGIMIGQLLPELAKQADKYSIIRSMTHVDHEDKGHETAAYLAQTGQQPGTLDSIGYPCVGAVVSKFKGRDAGYQGLLPPYIVLTKPQGRFSEAGFLGSRYKPFATGGNPANTPFNVRGFSDPSVLQRQRKRRELLNKLDKLTRTMQGDPRIAALQKCEDEAYERILGDGRKVFDLSTEDAGLRDRYGRSKFGQSCLVARRLVESGVPYVTINYSSKDWDWDTHKENFEVMQQRLPEMDKGMATLLEDLSDRGLLDSTIVWWGGEFGRSPRIAWEPEFSGGRHHHLPVFSAVVAGGGFKGGHVVGASDARGENVKDRPVYPCDLIGTIYELLGIDADATLQDPEGKTFRLLPSAADGVQSGGRLKEIV
ncbi:MAG: DUF1501 domain-containing protein [Pirellulaceae bacterium]|nr:DUF1501 domain-containing protein [Pirellulaceae bacterium]